MTCPSPRLLELVTRPEGSARGNLPTCPGLTNLQICTAPRKFGALLPGGGQFTDLPRSLWTSSAGAHRQTKSKATLAGR
eukprot:12907045-Prorocentrum_lima.AAC.1